MSKLPVRPLCLQTFAIRDVNEQREQIDGICVLFCIVAVISFFSQFLQVCISILQYNSINIEFYLDYTSLCQLDIE